MGIGQYQYIENWRQENDILLPNSEDDQHEFKSGLTPDKELGEKISVAASAFWNTGGGIFVAGVDGNGNVDGGIPETVGRQPRRDWVDQQIMKTQPPGSYLVNLIGTGASIQADKVVLVVGFGDSPSAHMAYDYRHYVRLGAHSTPANPYLVEAIRARKTFQSPILRALLQRSRRKSSVVELAIIVINDAVALNVEIRFEPLPDIFLQHFADRFPLQIPVIDRNHPFTMELYTWGLRSQMFGDNPFNILLRYEDAIGGRFEYRQVMDVRFSIDPMTLGKTDEAEVANVLRSVSSHLEALQKTLASRRKDR